MVKIGSKKVISHRESKSVSHSEVTSNKITREGPCRRIFKLVPQRAFLEDMAVMWTAAEVGVDVKKLEVRARHTKHINAVLVVAVYELGLVIQRWNDTDMTTVETSSHRWEASNFEEVTCHLWTIFRPSDDFIFESHEAVGNTVNHTADGLGWWTPHISEDVVETSRAKKVKKEENLKL